MFDHLLEFLNKDSLPNRFTITMGKLIREAREGRGLSQTQLAEIIGKRRASISEIENGKMMVDVISLTMMANHLQKPITYFFPIHYIKAIHPTDELTIEEAEILVQFRKIKSDQQRKFALQQVRSIADFETS
jgi:transcriptional regulator with XRE-family HTH domain